MYNVLAVLIDCLRQDRFEGPDKSAYTPNLDKLKQRSYYFDNVHTVGSNTTAVVGSWFTGLYPFNHGLRYFSSRKFNSDNIPTLASVLAAQGYQTLATATDSLETGEDVLKGFADVERLNKKKEPIYSGYGERVRNKIVELNQSQQPWFFFVHSAELHHRRQCEKKFQTAAYGKTFYDRGLSCYDHYLGRILDVVDPSNTIVIVFGDHGDNLIFEPAGELMCGVVNQLRSDISLPGLHQFREFCYKKGVLSRSKGILRSNFLFHHDYHVYRFLTHSPLMIALPGQVAPDRISAPVSSVDMLPTILDFLGLPAPSVTDGISLKPVMQSPDAVAPRRALYQEVFNEHLWQKQHLSGGKLPQLSAVVVDNWKLVASPLEPSSYPELYNLESDPNELNNIYEAPGNESIKASLHQQLNHFIAQMKTDSRELVSLGAS